MASSLDSDGQLTLMHGTGAGDSSGKDLGALADALFKSRNSLVVNVLDLVSAETANLSVSSVALTEGLLLRLGSSLLIVIHLTYLLLIMWDGPRQENGASAFLRTEGRRR